MCEESRTGVQAAHANGGAEAAGVDVALPVGACDDTAFAVQIATRHDGIGVVGVDLGEQQGGGIAALAMTRGVGAFARQFRFLVSREHVLVEALKRTLAVVESLRLDACRVDGGEAVNHELIALGSAFLGDFEAEGYGEHGKERVVVPHGILEDKGCALWVVALLFAPHVAHDVVGEVRPEGIWRWGQTFDEVRHLFGAEIQRDAFVLRSGRKTAAEQDGGDEEEVESFHILVIFMCSC